MRWLPCVGILLLAGLVPASAAAANWVIRETALTASKDAPGDPTLGQLEVTLQSTSNGIASKLTADVPLTDLQEAFTFNDKLVVLGQPGNAGIVLVFNILTAREIDRIVCYQPRRVSDEWIVYTEFYPNHVHTVVPTDVLLGYDLALSPSDNRLEKRASLSPEWGEEHVGFPLYPLSNVLHKSYANFTSDKLPTVGFLGSPIVLLSSGKLVVPVHEGLDASNYRTHLAVIDLSAGLNNPIVRDVGLPTDRYPRHDLSPDFMIVTKMEAVSPDAVRLILPQGDYGVSSIVVNVNHSPQQP